MNQLTVWIFDDDVMALMRAKETIAGLEGIAKRHNMSLYLKCSKELNWPPKFEIGWPKANITEDTRPFIPMPDIVVLDLFQGGAEFQGNEIFRQLRAAELKANKEAFVIIWSAYYSDEKALAFVKIFENGSRFIGLKTKDSFHLKEAVIGCIKRIAEESTQI